MNLHAPGSRRIALRLEAHCRAALKRGLIYSWCKLWGNGESNLLKLLEVRKPLGPSVSRWSCAAPPERIVSRSLPVTACRRSHFAPRVKQTPPKWRLTPIVIPRAQEIERVVVEAGPNAVDDWIAERAGPGAIVVTSDIPLGSRCVKSGADLIALHGKRFSESSIGMALATRDLMDHLRSTGQATSGPKAFGPRDRSNLLSALDNAVLRRQRLAITR